MRELPDQCNFYWITNCLNLFVALFVDFHRVDIFPPHVRGGVSVLLANIYCKSIKVRFEWWSGRFEDF